MTSKKYALSLAAFLLTLAAPAGAQAPAVPAPAPARIYPPIGAPAVRDGYIRVTATLNIFIAGPIDESEEAEKLRDRARRMIYGTAARECDLLRETMAQECILESVNSNLNGGQRYQSSQREGYTVSGTMMLSVKLKKE